MRTLAPPTSPDTIAPSAYWASPGAGNVANTITLQAVTADNYGVAGIQYGIDGSNIGGEVGAGGTVGLDTHMYGNGGHTLFARVRDAAGNVTTIYQNINVANSAPGAGVTMLGDHEYWDDGDGGWSNYRHNPPSEDDSQYGNWIWSGTGAKYNPVYLPGNPNPTYYQMRVWLQTNRVEGGSDGNVCHLNIQVGGVVGWTRVWDNGPSYTNIGPLWNVGGGNDCYAHWFADNPGWNTCFCIGIGFYYDFVPKYAS